MASLATWADAIRLGYTLPAGQEETLLARASARLRRVAGRPISSTTSTVRLPVEDGRVRLPSPPVTAVSAVTWLAEDGGDAVTGWRWDGREHILNVPQRHISGWSCAWRDVNVTHTHGFVTIPDELLDLVCSVAMRLGSVPSSGGMEAGVRSETIDDYSVTYAAEVVTHASGLLPGEEESLRAWLGSAPGAYVVRSR